MHNETTAKDVLTATRHSLSGKGGVMDTLRKIAARQFARHTLWSCDVPMGADFHQLTSSQVDALLVYADAERYRAPKARNGSRARYYHAMLQRRAHWPYPYRVR